MTYLDTSVLAAYYCPEALSEQAEAAILKSGSPAITPLVEVEMHSALARKVREGALSESDAKEILTRFRLHIDTNCYVNLPMELGHYTVARDWIGRFEVPLRTLDALHLAVCFASGATLLTADLGLARAGEHFRVRTVLLTP